MTTDDMSTDAITTDGTRADDLLTLDGVWAAYGDTTILRGVSLSARRGGVVALLGPNGAGKTTLLRTVSGLLRLSAGSVQLNGAEISRLSAADRVERGVCHIPEGRGIFPSLTVRENLVLSSPRSASDAIERAVAVFPALGERLRQRAGTMSGGQQQMLALSRAFLQSPQIILIDEASLGLAPVLVDTMFEALATLAKTGVSILLVEQYVSRALNMADHVYLIAKGVVEFDGPPAAFINSDVFERYLGTASDVAMAAGA